MPDLFYVIAGMSIMIAIICAVVAVDERKSCKEMEKRMKKKKESK